MHNERTLVKKFTHLNHSDWKVAIRPECVSEDVIELSTFEHMFLLSPKPAVRFYRRHLEVRNPI